MSAAADLTLAEAVPLGTVLLQRLLSDAEVRVLAIKGPAFVQLGVRPHRQSNDIDLMIHPSDRQRATAVLATAGWKVISHWFPPALDDVIYSTTFLHPRYPSTMDLHHTFSGFLAGPETFDALWQTRTTVTMAHQSVTTTSLEHALVIEALNLLKVTGEPQWPVIARQVVSGSRGLDPVHVAAAAQSVGAAHTAAPLIAALGGVTPRDPPPKSFARWRMDAGSDNTRKVISLLVRRAPHHVPRVAWQQLTLSEDVARFWAGAHRVEYRSPRQILGLRIKRLLGK